MVATLEQLKAGDAVLFPWAENVGKDWVHPQDLLVAKEVFPYGKVLRFGGMIDGWAIVQYGTVSLRAAPHKLRPVPSPRFWIGDRVVESSHGPGTVSTVTWHHARAQAFYNVDFDGRKSSKRFFDDDLLPLTKSTE